MSSQGRGIRTHKVGAPKPRKRLSETSKICQTEVEMLLAKIKQGQILPNEAKAFNQTLKDMSTVSVEPSVTEFISSVIKSLRSSLTTVVFHPVIRLYLLEIIELAASSWQGKQSSCYYYKEKAEKMPAVIEMTTSRSLQHSVSCPGHVTGMMRTPNKEICPPSDMTSSNVYRLGDGDSCNNNNNKNSIKTKVETPPDVNKTTSTRTLQYSVSYFGEGTNNIPRLPGKKASSSSDSSSSLHRSDDESNNNNNSINLKESSVYIKGHFLKLCCDNDDILQQAACVLLSHFADENVSSTVTDAILPSCNGQSGLEQASWRTTSPSLKTTFSLSSSTDFDLWQDNNTSRCNMKPVDGQHVTTSRSMSCSDAMESSGLGETHKKGACARRASSVQLKPSTSTHRSCQVIQYGKTFLLACAKSPIATMQPEGWQNGKDLPAVCLTKPTSYFDPSTYRPPEVLVPVLPESYMKHAALNTRRTNLAAEFLLMEDGHS